MSIFVVYTNSSIIGSPDRMWTLLKEAATLHPVSGNSEGSYLTMASQQGGYIGLVFVGTGFAASVDSQLFQKAIAADPRSTSKGYLLGGLAWFTIPFVLASTYGLAAAATEHLPSFPTYPKRMNAYEVSSGMAMPYAALAIMGNGGVIAVLLMVFMAVTSAMSSETVATTALLSYNVYKAYVNTNATEKQLKRFAEYAAVVFAIFAAAVACGFNHAGFSVGFLITAIGIFVDSAVVPMVCTVMWKKQSRKAVIIAPLVSSAAGLIAWFLQAWTEYGEITIETLSGNLPLVAGNMMALCGPLLLTPAITYLKPDDYDWNHLIENIRPQDLGVLEADVAEDVVANTVPETKNPVFNALPATTFSAHEEESSILLRSRNRSIVASLTLCLILLILWPVPMYATGYVFSRGFFKGWTVVLFLWAFFAAATITLMPIWEGRTTMLRKVVGSRNTEHIQGVPVHEEASSASDNKQVAKKSHHL